MEEREIDLIDLMVEILYRWKGLLLAAVIGAVLLGGFSYYKSMQAVRSVSYLNMPAEEAREVLERGLTASDLAAARRAVAQEAARLRYEAYFEDSVLMKLDPDSIPQASLVYVIKGSDRDESEAIASVYLQVLRSGDLARVLAEEEGISEAAVSELIRVAGSYDIDSATYELENSSSGSTTVTSTYTSTNYETVPSDSFTIRLRNATPELVSSMADAAEEYIKGIAKNNGLTGRSHTCSLVARTEGIVMDASLMERQKALMDAVYSSASSSVATAKDRLTGNALAYYDVLLELELDREASAVGDEDESSDDKAVAPVSMPSPSVSKKYVIIGAFAGIFVYAGCLLLAYLLGSGIHYTDDVSALYGISCIGQIPDDKKWGRNAYTKLLRKIRDRSKRSFPRDKAVELACLSIKELAEKKELSSLCVIGCNIEGQTADVCSSLVKGISDNGLNAEAVDNILYDPGAFKKFCGYKGVVLLEKAGGTMYAELVNELQKISEQGMSLLGAVIVE